ncbi:hypothetical protein NC653_035953 [Populus alba x Populus x berolinensis]|uniref:Uncharacterized protein n=1 Tax=Populus alba x Populus x berolinensis TaxID=444605 RepID=A0AAD6LIR1_9ROSI|nr:hypothetical protein NC653_035953 [Populus alba x Populus x berolinensis]
MQEAIHAKLVGVTRWTGCSRFIGEFRHPGPSLQFPLLGAELWLMDWQKELGLNATVLYRSWFEDKQI